MSEVSLRCMTWNHSRAFPPLVAAAQRFEELHPHVRIVWEKRSLHEFGHAGLSALAREFDLIVMDHPMLGDVEHSGALRDLVPLLTAEQSRDLADDSLGLCFESYLRKGKLYALPLDAAAPAASFRPDLMQEVDREVPTTWQGLLELARLGFVCMPAFPADLFLNMMGMCVSLGSEVAATPECLFDRGVGAICLEQLRELASCLPLAVYAMNPIAIYERMASTNDFAYCPFAYTYNNYSRDHFGRNRIIFADPVSLDGSKPMRTVLGGTGLALSARCSHPEAAFAYALYVTGQPCQRGIYSMAGGQGARRSAWSDPLLNLLTGDFFRRTAPSVERAYLRPRYRGYVGLQEQAGVSIARFLREGGSANSALDEIDCLYRSSQNEEPADA